MSESEMRFEKSENVRRIGIVRNNLVFTHSQILCPAPAPSCVIGPSRSQRRKLIPRQWNLRELSDHPAMSCRSLSTTSSSSWDMDGGVLTPLDSRLRHSSKRRKPPASYPRPVANRIGPHLHDQTKEEQAGQLAPLRNIAWRRNSLLADFPSSNSLDRGRAGSDRVEER